MKKPKNLSLIFDGDDTLWVTMPLYERAKKRFFGMMGQRGFDPLSVEEAFEHRDARNVRRFGFSKRRFRTSMIETYRLFCRRTNTRPSRPFEKRLGQTADSVFRSKPRVMPYAVPTLGRLKRHCRLFLVTKGQRSVQHGRLSASRLGRFFDHIIVVPDKNTSTFKLIVRKYRLLPALTWSVGNSIKSDINPALRAGLRAIWMARPTWKYEEEAFDENAITIVSSLREIPGLLPISE